MGPSQSLECVPWAPTRVARWPVSTSHLVMALVQAKEVCPPPDEVGWGRASSLGTLLYFMGRPEGHAAQGGELEGGT